MVLDPCLIRFHAADGGARAIRLGHRLLDDYLDLVAARARPNTLLATAFDLKVFFSVVAKDPTEVTTADVLAFITAQRAPRRGAGVVRLADGEAGLAARTIKRRLASISGLFTYLVVRGDVAANPVPHGLAARRPGQRPVRAVPLIRTPRTLPRVLEPTEINAFLAGLRTRRDRAMVEAMLLGGLRRCEVLGLRVGDLRPGQQRVFIAEGKGGHQRIVPISGRFFATVADYLTKGDRVMVTGRLRRRSWETPEGDKRSVTELEADEVGASLKWATAKVERTSAPSLRCLTLQQPGWLAQS